MLKKPGHVSVYIMVVRTRMTTPKHPDNKQAFSLTHELQLKKHMCDPSPVKTLGDAGSLEEPWPVPGVVSRTWPVMLEGRISWLCTAVGR